MGKVAKIFAVIAAVAIVIFAPQLAPMIGQFLGASGFLATAIGSIVIAVGLTALQMAFRPSGQGSSMEAGKINVKLAEAPRWICAGEARQGGAVVFADFDSNGNFWYVVIHSDSILTSTLQYYLDDELVTLSGSSVQNKEFRLVTNDDEKDPAETDGAGSGYVDIWTTTYTETNPTPPAIAELEAAFSSWTSDHKLVGTTYSVIRMKALKIEDRFKIFKWRGPIGAGEPAVSVAGIWSNMYDPRDPTQTLGDRTTYKPSNNSALIWAWFRTHPYGRRKPESSINWDRIAEQADICDESVDGIGGSHTRYRCGIAIPENKQRIIAEQEILLTMDGQIVFDDDGKTWARAGAYEVPTLRLSRNRDIVAMESVEAQNGESETQGVIIRYTDPEANYTAQPAAAWINSLYYVEGEAPQFLTFDILGCQDHNQAMRLAKAIGLRSQPEHKILPSVGLRGLRARRERIVDLNYDNTFAGDYEIVTPVEVDPVGVLCGFGCVPVDPDRWDLLPGEEKPKPVIQGSTPISAPTGPTGVVVSFVNSRIEATFTPDGREDVGYQFEYVPTASIADNLWVPMIVRDAAGTAYSGALTQTTEYTVRWRAISGSGRVSAWVSTTVNGAVVGGDAVSTAIYNSFILEVSQGVSVVSIASDGTLTIDGHTRRYTDGHADVSVTGTIIATGLALGATRSIAYDDENRVGGAVTYTLYADDADAHVSPSNPYRHYVGYFTVPDSGSSGGGGGGIPGGTNDREVV